MIRRLLAASVALLALAGCGAPPAPTGSDPLIGAGLSSAAGGALTPTAPTAVTIEAIDVESPPLVELGIDPVGALEVPPIDQPDVAGWFGVTPGAVGPSVLAAHVSGRVDGVSVPGLFARLDELMPGDLIEVAHVDGSVTRWAEDRVEVHEKTAFPTSSVYGDENRPVLHLITCTGDLVRGSYDANAVVFAELVTA